MPEAGAQNRAILANEKVRRWRARRVPVARSGSPEEIARAVVALPDAVAAFLTGETNYVDGGQGMNH